MMQLQTLQTAADTLKTGAGDAIARQQMRLASFGELVESRSPKHILRLGFAIARVDGHAVTSAKNLVKGQRLTVELADGVIDTKVL